MVFLIHGQTASYFLGWASDAGRAAFAHGPILWQAALALRPPRRARAGSWRCEHGRRGKPCAVQTGHRGRAGDGGGDLFHFALDVKATGDNASRCADNRPLIDLRKDHSRITHETPAHFSRPAISTR